MEPEEREIIITRFWSVIEQMSTEIGSTTIAAPAQNLARDLWAREGQTDTKRELFYGL